MDEDDLDAELLAVTDVKKGSSSGVGAASDSENGEFDGIAESDADDDKLDGDDDDDDDDDDSLDLDDDYRDDDYGARPKKRARVSKSRAQQAKSKKGGSTRAKTDGKKASSSKNGKAGKSSRAVATDRDSDTEMFDYKYDQDGYGDAADREELAKMSEINREVILADRKDERNKQFLLWEKKRELAARKASSADTASGRGRSSTRAKQSSKADALDALSQDIRKKSAAPIDMDVVDADSEGEPEPKPKREPVRDHVKEEAKPEAPVRDDDGPELMYSDLVTTSRDGNGVVTTPLFLRRDTVIHLSQQPYFARVVEGLFVRVRMADERDSYVLCRITGVRKSRSVYDLQVDKSLRTNYSLIVQSGATRVTISICIISSSHPTEREFNAYRHRAVDGGIEIPRRDEVGKLLKRAYTTIAEGKVTATEAEIKEHLENTQTVYPRRVNWTQKRTETQTNLDIKQQELNEAKARGRSTRVQKYEKEVSELKERLDEIRQHETVYGQQIVKTNTEVFQNLAKRNMMLNSKNDKLAQSQKILNTNTAVLDPFSRVETTGQSYFSIKQKGEDELEGENGAGVPSVHDWRTYLLSYESGAPRSTIGDDALEPDYGVALQGLDVFTDEQYLDPVAQKTPSLVPPGLDAVYDVPPRQEEELPSRAKTIGFEDWMKQRGTM